MVARGGAPAQPLETMVIKVSIRSPGGAKESLALPGLRIGTVACQGLRCASPLATIGRRSAAALAGTVQRERALILRLILQLALNPSGVHQVANRVWFFSRNNSTKSQHLRPRFEPEVLVVEGGCADSCPSAAIRSAASVYHDSRITSFHISHPGRSRTTPAAPGHSPSCHVHTTLYEIVAIQEC
jgi:hypothetical protein